MAIKLSDIVPAYSERQLEARKYIGKGCIIFYGGARGGGKSHLALYSAIENCLRYKYLRCCIIRKDAKQLERWFIPELRRKLPSKIYTWSERKKLATFHSTGSSIEFIGIDTDRDMIKIKGIPYSYIVIDEANVYGQEAIYDCRGSLRSADQTDFIPTMLMTGNPGEVGDLWFKRHFVNPKDNYQFWTENDRLYNKERFVYVPAKVDDNPNKKFVEHTKSELASMPEERRRMWLDGDWNVFSGQFFKEYSPSVHIAEPFQIPRNWRRVCGVDEGKGAHPSVVLWAAQDPSDETVYVYRELGSHFNTDGFAQETVDYMLPGEKELISDWWADSSMMPPGGILSGTVNDQYQGDYPYYIFLSHGILLSRANKDRINGWRMVKQWLSWTSDAVGEVSTQPKLKFFPDCSNLLETLPRMKYISGGKKDDLDTKSADDYVDALRYLIVNGFGYPSSAKVVLEEEDVDDVPMRETERKAELDMTTKF